MQTFYELVIYFVLFSFCGWVCESIFCSVNEKKMVNRGFLSGPVCPVYGFGGLIVVYVLAPFQQHIALLFLFGMIATTMLEYITSFVLEKLFHTKWWDYDGMFGNINGRVCLRFSFIFGGLSVVAVKLLYPPFSSLMAWIPIAVKPFLAWGLLAILVGDTTVTVISILHLNGKLAEMERTMKEFQERLGHLPGELPTFSQWVQDLKDSTAKQKDSGLKDWMEAVSKKVEAFLSHHAFQVKRLSKAFPNMSSTKYKEQLDKLKERILDRKSKIEKENED